MVDMQKEKALDLRLKGLSYREIGEALGVSRQRAQQLTRPPRYVYEWVRHKAGRRCEACNVRLDSGHVHHKELGKVDDYNDMPNLVYLCASCHRAAHTGGAVAEYKWQSCHCTRCEYNWTAGTLPKRCANPKCRSVYWQDERKQEKTR